MKQHPEDNEILNLIHQGASFKEKGFSLLVQKYGPLLYPQINRFTKNHEWTNDCLQNVFIKVFQNVDNFRGDAALYSWLFRIARNEALNFIEKEQRRSGSDISSFDLELRAGHTLLDQLPSDKIADLLCKAIDALPDKQAEVFELKYFQEKKYSEISVLLNTSEGALKASYHHAVKKIEEFLINALNH